MSQLRSPRELVGSWIPKEFRSRTNRRWALPGAKNTWIGGWGTALAPAVSVQSLCRLPTCWDRGHPQHLSFMSQSLERDCPCFFSSQVRDAGSHCWIPLLNLCPWGLDHRRAMTAPVKQGPETFPRKGRRLVKSLTVDFTRCHLRLTRHFSRCFTCVNLFQSSQPPHDMGAAAKSLQSCPTLCDPIDGSLPGSSAHEIFQARVLEWGAIAVTWKIRGGFDCPAGFLGCQDSIFQLPRTVSSMHFLSLPLERSSVIFILIRGVHTCNPSPEWHS